MLNEMNLLFLYFIWTTSSVVVCSHNITLPAPEVNAQSEEIENKTERTWRESNVTQSKSILHVPPLMCRPLLGTKIFGSNSSQRITDHPLPSSGGESISVHTWNKTTSADDFLTGVELKMCSANSRDSSIDGRCYNLTFSDCDCDAGCETYGYCCHDRVTNLTVASSSTGCLQSGSYAIVTCPQHWSDDDVRDRCETGTGRYTQDDPVSDLSTNTTFRNEFCASCHGVTSFSRWQLGVTCEHYQFMYVAVTKDTLIELILNHTNICSFASFPPKGITPQPCRDRFWFDSLLAIGSCNGTGNWKETEYDIELEKNCLIYNTLALRVCNTEGMFKNLFCAMCNGVHLTTTCAEGPVITVYAHKVPPLKLLFGLQIRERQGTLPDKLACLPGQWRDFENECRNLTCPAGKLLENDTCITALSQIRGLAYFLDINFTVTPPLRFTSFDFHTPLSKEVINLVSGKLRNKTQLYELQADVYDRLLPPPEFVIEVEHIRIYGEVIAPRYVDRDEAESAVVDDIFFSEWVLTSNDFESTTLRRKLDSNLPNDTENVAPNTFLILLNQFDVPILTPCFPADILIPLTPMLTCPHLDFGPSEYTFHSVNGTITKLILLGDESVEVEAEQLQRTWVDSEGKLLVCLDVLKNIKRPTDDRSSGSSLWQYVLTMVLMPLSMLCLVLTLVVYGLLPALRTQPGLNTMGTCCALFVAQLSLLLAAHRVTSGPSCQALGIVVHMSWLSVFCWTFICSLHMFRVFSAKTYHSSSSHRCRKLAINVSLTLAVPGAVVAAVVVAKSMTTDGSSIGYSDWRCYLESTLLVGVAMVLPVSLLLLLNLILFVLTVRRIHMVTKLNPRSKDQADSQNHVYVCARLSMLTGLTWMISLVAEGLEVDWLQFFSIIANGGQGVLLFLSYVTTRRVAAMLAVRLGLKEDTKSTSSTAVHTVSTKVN